LRTTGQYIKELSKKTLKTERVNYIFPMENTTKAASAMIQFMVWAYSTAKKGTTLLVDGSSTD
jgi:hypothetical protein